MGEDYHFSKSRTLEKFNYYYKGSNGALRADLPDIHILPCEFGIGDVDGFYVCLEWNTEGKLSYVGHSNMHRYAGACYKRVGDDDLRVVVIASEFHDIGDDITMNEANEIARHHNIPEFPTESTIFLDYNLLK